MPAKPAYLTEVVGLIGRLCPTGPRAAMVASVSLITVVLPFMDPAVRVQNAATPRASATLEPACVSLGGPAPVGLTLIAVMLGRPFAATLDFVCATRAALYVTMARIATAVVAAVPRVIATRAPRGENSTILSKLGVRDRTRAGPPSLPSEKRGRPAPSSGGSGRA